MIICKFDIKSIAVRKSEADAPLIVDRDRVLARAIALQRVQSVARGNPQIRQLHRDVDRVELSERAPSHGRGRSPGPASAEELFRLPVREGPGHIEL